jgi:adenosylcobinamide-GDP ribazoletransferase
MMSSDAGLGGLAKDLGVALLFCTRLPVGSSVSIHEPDLARASWAMPIAGAIVGVLGSLIYWLAFQLGLSPLPAAVLALATTMILTGALHEDGLADAIDGFGGGSSREHKLAIMRDSRIGTFGVCALATSLTLRWSALASIAEPRQVAMALIAAHVSARATLPALMRLVPPARTDGLSAGAGRPPSASIAAAGVFAAIALVIGLGPLGAVVGLLLLLLATTFVGWFALQQIGGQTGDVLGALEQLGEILILLTAATLYRSWSTP